ncbi:hypothetical protein H9Q08_00105 [Chryseobacterium sp. PS-8]|uniref:Mobilization protein n=1 Tax=Chryseobacterium indicum TaxID=2766954 RepID=A0ABS9BZH3_9FLAO|nr:hypothetical protein [Chryseobacterium sp. PS-8]MCF2217705.1 hypothetical protein [Chryseobacterium sp. PS-8]
MERKHSTFSRFLIAFFAFLLALMIGYNFIFVEPIGVLKNNNLILIAIILIIILSESFDNFSIGKYLTISRKLEESKNENEKLEKKNAQLINQLISITSNEQKQSSTNVFGDYYTERPNKQKKIDNEKNVQELLDQIGNSIVIESMEKNIKTTLITKGLDTTSETSTVLIRHLAGTQLLLGFERIHKYIFGSQLNLLHELNLIAPEGFTKKEIEDYFENVKDEFANSFSGWDVKKYLVYLFSNILIVKNDEKIHITNLGQEYLNWIEENNINDVKTL